MRQSNRGRDTSSAGEAGTSGSGQRLLGPPSLSVGGTWPPGCDQGHLLSSASLSDALTGPVLHQPRYKGLR
jgi:hypothetical protein